MMAAKDETTDNTTANRSGPKTSIIFILMLLCQDSGRVSSDYCKLTVMCNGRITAAVPFVSRVTRLSGGVYVCVCVATHGEFG
jgi:hypothetical protein